eukprot:3451084-Alexandrium_andersonii.AAC.1
MWDYSRFDGIDTSSAGSEGATPRAEAEAAPPAGGPSLPGDHGAAATHILETASGSAAALINDRSSSFEAGTAPTASEARTRIEAEDRCSDTEDDDPESRPVPTADNPHAMMGPAEMLVEAEWE